MDSDYQLDLAELRHHLEHTQVVGFYFPFIRRTLLLDLRTSKSEPPMVIVAPMVQSAEERVRSLRKLRPRLPRPESMALLPWPRYVAALDRLGILELVERRLVELGGERFRERCREAVADLVQCEQTQVRHAITGEGHETLWQRRQAE